MSIVYQRQNEPVAIHYLKASEYCFRREKLIKYSIMVISVLLTIVGIIIKFMPNANAITTAISSSAKYLTFVSGVFVVASIFLNKHAHKYHIEGVNILELYDNYVFGLQLNPTILRPINELTINNYANRYGNKVDKLYNFYFSSPEAEPRAVTFNRYQEIYNNDYKLMTRITGFYHFIWMGFIIAILFFAVYVDETFVESLSNILIPSLSAITLIFNAWYSMNEDKNFLQRTIKYLSEVQSEVKKGTTAATSPLLLRSLQDGLFSYRMRSFTVPQFLVKSYKRSQQRKLNRLASSQQAKITAVDNMTVPILPVKSNTPAKKPQVALASTPVKSTNTQTTKKPINTEKIVTPVVKKTTSDDKAPVVRKTTPKAKTTNTVKKTTNDDKPITPKKTAAKPKVTETVKKTTTPTVKKTPAVKQTTTNTASQAKTTTKKTDSQTKKS